MNYSHPSSADDFTREFWIRFSAVYKEHKETKEKREGDHDKESEKIKWNWRRALSEMDKRVL